MTKQCKYHIEKDWPGHMAVLWRKQCKNKTKHPSGYCHQHRPYVPRIKP